MELKKRDFQQEWNDKMKALKSTEDLFKGTSTMNSLQELAEQIYKHLPNLRMTDMAIKYFVELVAIKIGEVKETDLLNFSVYINMIPKLSAKELDLSIEDYIIIQSDARTVIDNYNLVIGPIREEHQKEAKKYEVKMNPPGSRK